VAADHFEAGIASYEKLAAERSLDRARRKTALAAEGGTRGGTRTGTMTGTAAGSGSISAFAAANQTGMQSGAPAGLRSEDDAGMNPNGDAGMRSEGDTNPTLRDILGGEFDLSRAVIEAEILTPKYL
jgi:hypothetical protein